MGRTLALVLSALVLLPAHVGARETDPGRQSARLPAQPAPLSTDLPAGLLPDVDAAARGRQATERPERPSTAAAALEAVVADVATVVTPLQRAVTPQAADAEDEEVEPVGSLTYAVAAGDLDGDGHDDVLAADWSFADDRWVVEALGGTDGATLWSRADLPGELWWALLPLEADVTGDGAVDLLLVAVADHEVLVDDCPADPWEACTEYEVTWSTELALVSGVDGSTAWSTAIPGGFRETSNTDDQPLSRTVEESWTLTGGLWALELIADAGGPRLAVGTRDWSVRRTTSEERVLVLRLASTTTVEVEEEIHLARLGLDGTVHASASWPTGDTDTVGSFADLDGDGTHEVVLDQWTNLGSTAECDLLSCTQTSGMGMRMVVASLDLDEAWRADYPQALGGVAPTRHDLDGDGVLDLLAVVHTWDDVSWLMLSGADGRELYRQAEHGYSFARPIPDVSGDGLPDMLYAWFDVEARTAHFRRERGTDGGALLTTTHRSPHADDPYADAFLYFGLPGDLTGSGEDDLLLNWQHFRDTIDEDEWRGVQPLVSSVEVESLRTGVTAWAVTDLAGAVHAAPAGDVDGDGLGDVLGQPWWFGEAVYTAYTIRGVDGSVLWSHAERTEWMEAFAAGSADGESGDDVVLVRDVQEPDGRWHSVLELRNGASGDLVWTRRSS